MRGINGISKWLTYTGSTIGMVTGVIDHNYSYAGFAFTTFIWCFLYNDLLEKNGI